MKFNLKLLAPAAALLLASTASADVTIYINGSSAFRAATVTAIKNVMSFGTGQGYAFVGGSFTGSNNHVFVGSVTGITGTVTVKTSWDGSVAGVKSLNSGATQSYLAFPASGTAYTLSATGTSSVNTNNLSVTASSDIAMADNLQASTKYTGTALTQTKVGIIPFSWVASPSAPSGLTTMTPQLAKNLFKVGYTSAALFTNNNADADDQVGGTRVYAIGRDPLSGTRLDTFAESGIGIFTTVSQYQPATIAVSGVDGVSGTTAITDIELTQANAAVDAPTNGENGFTSGGNLADLARYTTASVTDQNGSYAGKVCFVTYLGEGDANRAVNGTGSSVTGGNAKYLSYNGATAFGGLAKSFAECTITSGNAVVTFPATTVNGTPTAQSTTGLQAGQLIRSTNFPGDTVIVSVDSATQITVSSNATSSNGTTSGQPNGALSTSIINPASIWSGAYTFWGNEYIMWKTTLAGDAFTFAGKLKDQIKNTDYFQSGLSISGTKMRVQRSADGGTVSQNY